MTHRVETGPGWELREGRWQFVLDDIQADALVSDFPYSERTHTAYSGDNSQHRGADYRARVGAAATGGTGPRRSIDYAPLTRAGLTEAVEHWSPRVSGWTCWLTSHDLVPDYERDLSAQGRYVFAPLPCVIRGMTVRLVGDGPSSESVSLVVARPRTSEMAKWGTLPGHYYGPSEKCIVVGGKPLWLMRQIIRDYTRPGDLVVDPCAGGGTTLLAAVMEGRRAIGAEMDPITFDKAVARLRKGYTAPLVFDEAPRMEQTGLSFPMDDEPLPEEPIDREPEPGPEFPDDGCGWCGDGNCDAGCPDNPHAREAAQ